MAVEIIIDPKTKIRSVGAIRFGDVKKAILILSVHRN